MLKQVFVRLDFHNLGPTICLRWHLAQQLFRQRRLLLLPLKHNTFTDLVRSGSATLPHKRSAHRKIWRLLCVFEKL